MVPHLPATLGETIFVALSHVLDYVDEHGHYPHQMSENMRKVLASYASDRTKALAAQGISQTSVDRYTALAAESLAKWLDNQATKHEMTQEDFDRWAEELTGDDQ